jgi:hypothetical protein
MTKPAKNKPNPSGLSEAWTTFAQKLATVLAKLEEDD